MRIQAPERNRFVRSTLFASALFLTSATVASPAEAKQSMYFASDIHTNVSRLPELIDHLKTLQPIDFYGLVGDYGDAYTTAQEYGDVVGVFSNERTGGAPYVLAQGNHDARSLFYTDPTGPVSASRLPNNTTYNAYVINFEDFQRASTDVSGPLLTYLNSYTEKKVLFILCHYPPHSTRGDVTATRALALFNTINDAAAAKKLDIVLLWGHNHRNASYDQGVDTIVTPGNTVGQNTATIITGIAGVNFNFAYVNAGYILPITGASPETLYSSVITVTDTAVLIDRYRYPKTQSPDAAPSGYDPQNITLERQATYARKSPVRAIGDVNGDGKVDVVDALMTAQYAADLSPEGFFVEAADVDLNRKVDIIDALLLAQYSVGVLTTLPPPATHPAPVAEGAPIIE